MGRKQGETSSKLFFPTFNLFINLVVFDRTMPDGVVIYNYNIYKHIRSV
jgi:hypothetical protein